MSFVARVSRPSCEKKPSLRIAGNVAIPFLPKGGRAGGQGRKFGGRQGCRKAWGCSGHLFFPRPRYAVTYSGLCEGSTRDISPFRPTRKKGGKRIRRGALSKPIRRPQDGTQRTSSAKT